jgi:L-lactate utilization protein LutB
MRANFYESIIMNKPFSNDYVIRETLRHMQQSVAISTQKTIARLPEFQNQPEKIAEVMTTLASLGKLNSLIEEIRENNKSILGE